MMAAWSLLKNRQAVTILLWYVTSTFVFSSNLSVFPVPATYIWSTVGQVALSLSAIILYFVLGLFADAFIGRYRLIQFSLWVQWITVIMSTFISAML